MGKFRNFAGMAKSDYSDYFSFKMSDTPKVNGGAREGAGRKPKADEIKLIEQMDAILVPEKAWKALAKLVESEDHNAIKTWLGYRFGMPRQSIAHSGSISTPEEPLTIEKAKELKDLLSNL